MRTIITIGTDADDSRSAVELATRLPGVWASVGIHPHAADRADANALAEIRRLAAEPRVVAIGETGLDFHYDNSPRAAQRTSFAAHLDMGRALDLPVVVHCREADDDVRALLREAGTGTRGVLHCFSAGRELLDDSLELGWYISFAGMITFRRFGGEDLVRAVPDDRILTETDSPYLAPVPHRGKTNEPALVVHTTRRAAEIRDVDPDLFAARCAANARDLFRLPAEA